MAECPTSNDISPRPKNNDVDLNSSSSSYNNGLQNRVRLVSSFVQDHVYYLINFYR